MASYNTLYSNSALHSKTSQSSSQIRWLRTNQLTSVPQFLHLQDRYDASLSHLGIGKPTYGLIVQSLLTLVSTSNGSEVQEV